MQYSHPLYTHDANRLAVLKRSVHLPDVGVELRELPNEPAHARVLLVQGDVLGGQAGGLELPEHEAELPPAEERVHVGEGGLGHGGRVALILAGEEAGLPGLQATRE